METIRNYLESMFANLPNTPEVIRAKNELWQMMEDKYTELKEEGKSENEAIGIVISEFGNLDELSEDLGIKSFMNPDHSITRRSISMDEAKQYIHDSSRRAIMTALGVFLCITSPTGAILLDSLYGSDTLGFIPLFCFIAIAVMLFIFPGITMQKWDFLEKEPCSIDFATTRYVQDQKEHYRTTYALLLTAGVALCIVSVIPPAIFDTLNSPFLLESFGAVLLFLLVAVGVFSIVLANLVNASYSKLLRLNDAETVSGNFVPAQHEEEHYRNPAAKEFMSAYWPTITCLYLIWSFLTFDWHISWIIWPIAAVIHGLLKNLFEQN